MARGDGKETADALHKRGNEAVGKGEYRDALRHYAAALAKLERPGGGFGTEAEKERAATIRSNRALCYLRMDDPKPGFALQEAEKAEEMRPEWPKAYFRKAAALEALGRLGEARLALCYARRLAPGDKEVRSALTEVRLRIFGDGDGAAARIGVALDTLEDFSHPPSITKAAAKELKDILLPGSEDVSVDELSREKAVRAFLDGKGADTLFRRQNAMTEHWKEEAKNGTMSMLSIVAKAAPELEEALVDLNHEAEHDERGEVCESGDASCRMPPQRVKLIEPPPPPKATRETQREGERRTRGGKKRFAPQSMGGAYEGSGDEEEGDTTEATSPASPSSPASPPPAAPAAPGASQMPSRADRRAARREQAELSPPLVESSPPPAAPAPPTGPAPPAQAERRAARGTAEAAPPPAPVSRRQRAPPPAPARPPWQALVLAALPGPEALRRFGAAAAASRAWAAGARLCRERRLRLWGAWAEPRWPGAADCLVDGAASAAVLRAVVLQGSRPAPPKPDMAALLAQWSFFVQVRREAKVLWRAALSATSHSLYSGPPPKEATATLFERADVCIPGDTRRLGAAGVAAAFAANDGCVPEGHAANVMAVHVPTGRIVDCEAQLAQGSRLPLVSMPPGLDASASSAGLRAVVGFGVGAPKGKVKQPQGSVEVTIGLAFLGPDGLWLPGAGPGSVMLAALLEAAAEWQLRSPAEG